MADSDYSKIIVHKVDITNSTGTYKNLINNKNNKNKKKQSKDEGPDFDKIFQKELEKITKS